MRTLDLDPAALEMVRAILREQVPGIEVRAFGSRVTGTARRMSDLDLAVMTGEPMDLSRRALLREAFTESALPIRVDVVDWAATGGTFRRIVEEAYVVVQEAAPAGRATGENA